MPVENALAPTSEFPLPQNLRVHPITNSRPTPWRTLPLPLNNFLAIQAEASRPHLFSFCHHTHVLATDLTAELGGLRVIQGSIGGGTPALCKHQTFTLVIGINKYESVPNENLLGAVKDAENFKTYLLEDLGVPKDNIINLRNEQATRSAIINQFRQLEGDLKIVPGEVAIIIYFAGHGALATKPDTWTDWVSTDENTIEMLCPADIGALDANSKVIEGVPDRTINWLLLDLSIAKGNKITLILDCCHAAGMNCGALKDSRVRNFKNYQNLSPSCDEDIYSREYRTRLYQEKKSGFSHHSFWGSHVLLAACKSKQDAREEGEQSIFTSALLKPLKYFASKDLIPMYDSLMKHLSMPDSESQTPLWDGKHIRRRLFDSWQDPASSSMIPCYKVGPPLRSTDHLTLSAGSLHGITKNSTFEIFKSDLIHQNLEDLLAILTVTEVQDHVSQLLLTPSHSSLFDLLHNE
ncbi:uncharacterized protein ARMOST_11360 [Armillaria ostoyae]|uniref:Peptidase C14 caspase domain-containing protein n=1 Tax=Armillaria ostoyae TaxID=47428 RepID=A0A284RGX0_ARMOS|nr:uncharacterized protein ARMOST_11360 [Armillaria ostoyae]